ncbi:MAG: type II 3-dehydroquinate dehydratase, partial [Pseudomonadota bacterium]
MARALLVLNGPNLNLLGRREPNTYGQNTLNDLEDHWKALGATLDFDVK